MAPSIDPQQFRDVLGHYPTGVSVITALSAAGEPMAMVVGTFTSVSLDPPLVAFLPNRTSTSFARLKDASRFAVNILAHDQEELVRRLARSDPRKMDDENWRLSPAGNPVLDGVVAVIECDLSSVAEAGDHYIVIGAVTDLYTERPTVPLLFFRGGYGEFAPKSFVVTEGRGMSGAVTQAQVLRSPVEQAAGELGGELTLFGRVAGDSVALATAAAPGGSQITPLGTRYPIAPPIGAQYVAWADAREQDSWIDKAIGATRDEIASYRRHLEDARRWGWSVNVAPDDAAHWPAVFPEVDGSDDAVKGRHAMVTRRMAESTRGREIDSLLDDAQYQVIGFVAPIFLAEGTAPELMVRLLLYPSVRMSKDEILRKGALLKNFAVSAAEQLRDSLATASAR
ncbi:flavin reductase family protein [Microbacterium lushaniae]|nr:flavin reductase family protein [Microbacterium lushaniae]